MQYHVIHFSVVVIYFVKVMNLKFEMRKHLCYFNVKLIGKIHNSLPFKVMSFELWKLFSLFWWAVGCFAVIERVVTMVLYR